MEQLLNEIPVTDELRTLIGLAAILVLTVLASTILRSVIFSAIGRFTARTGTTLDDRLLDATKTYSALLVYVFGLSILFDFIGSRYPDYIGPQFIGVVQSIIYSLGVIVVSILLVKVVSAFLGWYSETIAVRTETTLDDEFIPLLDRTTKIVVVTLAVLIILDHFSVDVKGLVAVLGVGSLAVALAAQDTLANMIAGFTIMIDRPFRIGDMVWLSDQGRVIVHEIGIRSTKFLTFDNTLVIVPNAELIKSTVHNVTYPQPHVRVMIDVGVDYSSDINQVRDLMLAVADENKQILDQPAPDFLFLSFGDSSLDVSLRCYVAQAQDHRKVSSALRLAILERFRAAGVEIPFPQRVVTMVNGSAYKTRSPSSSATAGLLMARSQV